MMREGGAIARRATRSQTLSPLSAEGRRIGHKAKEKSKNKPPKLSPKLLHLRCLALLPRKGFPSLTFCVAIAIAVASALPFIYVVQTRTPSYIGSRKSPHEVVVLDLYKSSTGPLMRRERRLGSLSHHGHSYGGLKIGPLPHSGRRKIYTSSWERRGDRIPDSFATEDDPYDPYDDDSVRSEVFKSKNRKLENCRRPE